MLSTSLRVGRGTQDTILSIWFMVEVPGNNALPVIRSDREREREIEMDRN